MYWLYLICSLGILIKMMSFPILVMEIDSVEIVNAVVQDTGIPNAVSGIILRNRLYDTVFEVVVFTIAIMGVSLLLSNERLYARLYQLPDESSMVLAKLGATLSTLVAIELAIRGHLSPGGGFAAGIAGGTAIGLVAMTSDSHVIQDLYQRWRVAIWEKIVVLLLITISFLVLVQVSLPAGEFGVLMSGGWIPLLNILIAIKVAIGAWAIILAFIRARGLF